MTSSVAVRTTAMAAPRAAIILAQSRLSETVCTRFLMCRFCPVCSYTGRFSTGVGGRADRAPAVSNGLRPTPFQLQPTAPDGTP